LEAVVVVALFLRYEEIFLHSLVTPLLKAEEEEVAF
jgi:hypothetical protein